jgi:hypothetical protein
MIVLGLLLSRAAGFICGKCRREKTILSGGAICAIEVTFGVVLNNGIIGLRSFHRQHNGIELIGTWRRNVCGDRPGRLL